MHQLMPESQQSTLPTHRLGGGEACTLAATGRGRWLLVAQGRVWLTGLPTEERGGDVWLARGEWVWVPAGAQPVVEAEATAGPAPAAAEFLLLEASRPWAQRVRGGGVARLREGVRAALAGALRADLRAA